jgi:hypothetical protein
MLVAATMVVALGCASTGAKGAARGNSNVITEEEITAGTGATAFEIIQRLRPSFLHTRGAMRSAPTASNNNLEPIDIVVYMNDNRFGGSDRLRQISVSDIREIRYFSASEATTKWGSGHGAGAIQILSCR